MRISSLQLKCNEFFALARRELALLPTPLLRRFFSPLLSPDDLPGLTPLLFSRLLVSSESQEGLVSGAVEAAGDSPV